MTHISVRLVTSMLTLMSQCLLMCQGSRLTRSLERTGVHSGIVLGQEVVDVPGRSRWKRNVQADLGSEEDADILYGVLLDAGSSSTKVKVYTYTEGGPPTYVPRVQLRFSHPVKPGLSHFINHLDDLEDYLAEIFRHAVLNVPEHRRDSTPVYLLATAGLRTLSLSSTKSLLANARSLMTNKGINPFKFNHDHVSVISGEEEAAFAWLAVNYLHGFFSSNMSRDDSVGLLEMGGGSMQVAFLPDGPLYQEEFQVYVGQRRFDLYVQTYLSFGSNYISEQVLRIMQQDPAPKNAKNLYNPCMLAGDTAKYAADAMKYKLVGTGNASLCENILTRILKPAHSLHCSPQPCAIGDRYQPEVGAMQFYAISAFVYAPTILNAVQQPGDKLNIDILRQNAREYCSLTLKEAVSSTGSKAEFASSNCLMGLYIPLLLTQSLGFTHNTRAITTTGMLNEQSIDWALGAMVQQLSMAYMAQTRISCQPLPKTPSTRANSASGPQAWALTAVLLTVFIQPSYSLLCFSQFSYS